MQLRHLELFCAAVQNRGVSNAAKALGVSQPLVTQAVKALEDEFGVPLIDRRRRPLVLTRDGEILYEEARDVREAVRRLEARMRQRDPHVAGPVRVAAIYSVGMLQMDRYERRFHELYPDADVRVDYLHPDEVREHVLHETADVGLISFARPSRELESIPWQEQLMVAAVPTSHRLAGVESVSVKELAGEDFVHFTDELAIRREINRWLKEQQIEVHVVQRFDNIENIKSAVEDGRGIALLPLPTVQREHERKTLCAVRLADVRWHRPLSIIHRRHGALSEAAAKFVELLQQDPEAWPNRGAAAESSHNGAANGHNGAHGATRQVNGRNGRRRTSRRADREG